MIENFCKLAIEANGNMYPLIIPSQESKGLGLTNPSIHWNGKELITNVRHVQYALYHSEKAQKFQNQWGCLAYLNPEDDITLRTKNYLITNAKDNIKLIDTSKLDVTPLWEFIGLEDARIAYWNDKIYLCGVRRDTTSNGVGRLEISEIQNHKEVRRYRIEPPNGYSYCEKNWMPIADMPFHFVKWTNPTEVVKVDIETLRSETIKLVNHDLELPRDIRGGSQVILYEGFYIAVTHEVDLWYNQKNNKDAQYYHRFIVWDKNWNIVKVSDEFKFLGAQIEFCCGLTQRDDKLLLTFGFQDTTAFVLEMTTNFIKNFLKIPVLSKKVMPTASNDSLFNEYAQDSENPSLNFDLGIYYFEIHQYTSAMSFLLRTAEMSDNKKMVYHSLVLVAVCLNRIGRRRASEKTALLNAIAYSPLNYEGHYLLSQWYEQEQDYFNCYTSARMSEDIYEKINKGSESYLKKILEIEPYKMKFQIAFSQWWIGRFSDSRKGFFDLANEYADVMNENYKEMVQGNITRLGSGDKFLSYNQSQYESLRLKFHDLQKVERNFSQTYQDMFVLFMAQGKQNGTYVEIGSADPEYGSNTKLLESHYNWKGVGIEILEKEVVKHKNSRKNPVFCKNALEVDYKKLLTEKAEEYKNDGFFDYLQVDCEPPSVSFQILKMIPFDDFKFGVVTFEHDYYADLGKTIREKSREYMKSKGYILAIGNVSMNDDCPYEDWWVHKDYEKSQMLMDILNDDSEVVNMEKYIFDYNK